MGSFSSLFSLVNRSLPLNIVQTATAIYFRATALSSVGLRGFHSAQKLVTGDRMRVRILPALSDNYMYLLVDNNTNQAAIVDPVEPDTVLAAVEEEGVELTTVLTTHHHWDHAGGNKEIVKRVAGLTVLGGDERIDGVTKFVRDGDSHSVGDIQISCLFTPCHTTGHICYYVTQQEDRFVFTGDTLFLGGSGRFFEGTAEMMYSAMVEKLSSLPADTKVYCGHEYSLQNLAFGHHVEPENQAITEKISWCRELRESSPPLPTVPSTIAEEKLINPFMRVGELSVQKHAGQSDPVETMRALRAEKDNFKKK